MKSTRALLCLLLLAVSTSALAQSNGSATNESAAKANLNAATAEQTPATDEAQAPAPTPEPPPPPALASSAQPSTQNLIQISAALDLLTLLPIQNNPPDMDRIQARAAEFTFYGAVDPMFDAVLNLAGHNDAGEFEFGLHEGYVTTSRWIPRSRVKVGKFLLGAGRLNQFHQHDWPFPSAPRVFTSFFSEEGVMDSGLEYGWLAPTDFYFDLTAGITSGYTYAEAHGSGERPLTPTHYLHPVFFTELENGGIQTGLTYLGRTDNSSRQMRLLGIDITYKKRTGRTLDWLVQSEIYHRLESGGDVGTSDALGGYVYSQKGLNEFWSAGLRLDAYTVFTETFLSGDRRNNLIYAVVPVLSYKASEFSTLRAAYTFENETRQGNQDRISQKVELQLTTFLGAHPAHDF